jgi:hypothetical protein
LWLWLRPGALTVGEARQRRKREEAAAGRKRRGAEHREKKGKERGDKGLTLNLLAFSLSVSLIYIRGVTIANGLGPSDLIL